MANYAIIMVSACVLALWLYSCYKNDVSERREKKAIKQALKDAGYV